MEILRPHRFNTQNEKALQQHIWNVLNHPIYDKTGALSDVGKFREYHLDEKNIPDFFLESGLAIEVKIKGSRKHIYKQCDRYLQFDQVKALLLITSRAMSLPEEVNGKRCFVYQLGMSWL